MFKVKLIHLKNYLSKFRSKKKNNCKKYNNRPKNTQFFYYNH